MMNKKAIAAFAAGATLLAGFAMATPAMAACPVPAPLNSAAKAAADDAYTKYATAKAALDAMTVTPKPEALAGVLNTYINVTPDPKTGLISLKKTATTTSLTYDVYVKVKAYVDAFNANVTETKAKNAKQAEVNELLAKYLDAKNVLEKCAVADPTQDEKNQKMIDAVRHARVVLDNADNALAKAKKAYDAAADAAKKALNEFNARTAAAEAAHKAYEAFLTSGVNNSAESQRLHDAANRADAHLTRATNALTDARKAYYKAFDDATKAVSVYNDALTEYKRVYNEAVEMGINPSDLPPVVTSDPLAADFPTVPGLNETYAKALKGDFGAAAQKAVQTAEAKAKAEAGKNGAAAGANGAAAAGAAAGKAGAAAAAKGELATKGGNGHGGKAGEKLGNAGVGVALTALAASMLAGMGAAVRKMRH